MGRLLVILAGVLTLVFGHQGGTDWRKVKKEALEDPLTTQLLLVKYSEGCDAEAFYYVRRGSHWKLRHKAPAQVGRNGIDKEREGDGKSPTGDFMTTVAFGVLPNPGYCGKYIDLNPFIIGCDSEGPYYNRIIDIRETGEYAGEKMSECIPAYNYGYALNYNPENIYPLGSAIFLHCLSGKAGTAGCVAVDEDFMRMMLVDYRTGFQVSIYRK